MEDLTIHQQILALLKGKEFTLLEHDHVHTSEDAAKVRGTKLEEAAKALVLKDRTRDELFMCVVSGHRRLDLKKIKEIRNSKNISLAHPDEVFAATACKVGTVPPFPILFKMEGYADEGILENMYVVFSAASHVKSVRVLSKSWAAVAGVVVAELASDYKTNSLRQ